MDIMFEALVWGIKVFSSLRQNAIWVCYVIYPRVSYDVGKFEGILPTSCDKRPLFYVKGLFA